MNKSLMPLIISLGIIVLNVVLDAVFDINGALLALSTAAAMTIGAVITIIIMFKGEKIVNLAPAAKSLAASCGIGIVAYELKQLLVHASDGKLLLVVKCGGIGVVSLILFVVLCFLLRIDAVTDIVRKKLGKS